MIFSLLLVGALEPQGHSLPFDVQKNITEEQVRSWWLGREEGSQMSLWTERSDGQPLLVKPCTEPG